MARLRFIMLVLAILFGALFTMASSAWYSSEKVVILPGSGEVSISSGQMVRASLFHNGMFSCSRGMDLDYREAAIVHLELWRGERLAQVIEKRDGRWNTSKVSPNDLCMHVNSPYLSNWNFNYLRFYEAGDYELRWTRGVSVPHSDGADYAPADGYLDLYQPSSQDFVVLIHVQAGGRHGVHGD